MRIKVFGEEHEGTADSHRELGVTQYAMHDYTSALQSYQCAFSIRIKVVGEELERTADSYFNLGATQYQMHDYTSALQSDNVHRLSVLKCLEKNMKELLAATGNSL